MKFKDEEGSEGREVMSEDGEWFEDECGVCVGFKKGVVGGV